MVYLGLPIKKGWSFHGYVTNNQMVNSESGIHEKVVNYHRNMAIEWEYDGLMNQPW